MIDADARKRGDRTGLDTLVVHAVNDELKLKGIDGGPHKRRNMWFNSMIREEPYPGSNGGRMGPRGPSLRTAAEVLHGCRQLVP